MGLHPNSLPGANSSSNSGDQQGNNGSSTGLLPIFIIAGVIVLLLLLCFFCAITRCPTDCVESDDVESTAGVASADLKPSLETLDREAPAKDFAQVKEEAKQRKPGDQPAWPESYYAWPSSAFASCVAAMCSIRAALSRGICANITFAPSAPYRTSPRSVRSQTQHSRVLMRDISTPWCCYI
ncbi:unnamed protein product [Clonostachys chloroleuca]|uniref:Uncharacterized protein n=1 Tax=Clonostachys chloroleuca TaxID=1926264 RepID=A0AA35M325_9HYPO|nr:unnamed protein product [Clonostachys chloroleuca]